MLVANFLKLKIECHALEHVVISRGVGDGEEGRQVHGHVVTGRLHIHVHVCICSVHIESNVKIMISLKGFVVV